MVKLLNKKGVSAIIATVLIVFITVTAAIFVGSFVINMVKDNLNKGGGCFNALDKISIKEDVVYTCFNSTTNVTHLMINRSSAKKDVEMEGIKISLVGDGTSKVFDILNESVSSGVSMYDSSTVRLPNDGESYTYNFETTFRVGTAKASIILSGGEVCEGIEEIVPAC